MHTTYFDEDDILVIRLSDKPIAREVSQNWNTHISYAEDGNAVEVLLESCANGAYPLEVQHARAAREHVGCNKPALSAAART